MKKSLLLTAFVLATACGQSYPTLTAPGLDGPKISMLFEFPEGSTCRVATSSGLIETSTVPSKIDFSMADRNAPASCTLPSGEQVSVTAHNFVPDDAKNTAGITVYPDGDAFITASTPAGLVNLQPTGTVN